MTHTLVLAKRYFSTLQQGITSKLHWWSDGVGFGITSYGLQTKVQYKVRRLGHLVNFYL